MRIFTNFGKHKLKELTDEKEYCKWILNSDFDEEIKKLLDSFDPKSVNTLRIMCFFTLIINW